MNNQIKYLSTQQKKMLQFFSIKTFITVHNSKGFVEISNCLFLYFLCIIKDFTPSIYCVIKVATPLTKCHLKCVPLCRRHSYTRWHSSARFTHPEAIIITIVCAQWLWIKVPFLTLLYSLYVICHYHCWHHHCEQRAPSFIHFAGIFKQLKLIKNLHW